MSASQDSDNESTSELAGKIGRLAGPLVALAVYFLLPDHKALTDPARATAAIGALMAVWWMTEAIPLPVTALMPLLFFPLADVYSKAGRPGDVVKVKWDDRELLGTFVSSGDDGTTTVKLDEGRLQSRFVTVPSTTVKLTKSDPLTRAAQPYAHKYIFLFMGGFLLALGIERCGLHRRIALLTIRTVGTRPSQLIAGFMLATAFLSMWISNTAATAMMLPIAASVVTLLIQQLTASSTDPSTDRTKRTEADARKFATCLMLAVAYSASVGGVASLVGTPTNIFLAGFLEDREIKIGFAQWMAFGVPLSITFLIIAWFMLTQVTCRFQLREIPGGKELIRAELRKLGPTGRAEWTVLSVFLATAALWIFRKPLTEWAWLTSLLPVVGRIDDTIIALLGGLSLFLIPVGREQGRTRFGLDWETAKRLPWGMLLLFGGGLSLAAAVLSSGLDDYISASVSGLSVLPPLAMMLAVTTIVIFLTELTSNTPTASLFLPILAAFAATLKSQGQPVDMQMMVIPAAVAASFAFMLPVATPPNAIVFASGHVRIRDMIKNGFWLNLIGIVLVTLAIRTLGRLVF